MILKKKRQIVLLETLKEFFPRNLFERSFARESGIINSEDPRLARLICSRDSGWPPTSLLGPLSNLVVIRGDFCFRHGSVFLSYLNCQKQAQKRRRVRY